MKEKRWLVIVLVLLGLFLALPVLADDFPCLTDSDCDGLVNPDIISYCPTSGACYCAIDPIDGVGYCYLNQTTTYAEAYAEAYQTTTSPPAINQTELDTLRQKITALEIQLQGSANVSVDIRNKLASLEAQYQTLQVQQDVQTQSMQSLQEQVMQLQTAVLQEKQERDSAIATGLAGLQQNLDQTNTELVEVEEGLAEEQKFTRTMKIIFFTLLVIAVALVVAYFITRKPLQKRLLDRKTHDYITAKIKEGKKYHEIKEHLLDAGWNEEDIKWAYNETVGGNYRHYLEKIGKAPPPKKKAGVDRNKAITITVFSVLLILGVFFLLRGITGQAVHFGSEQELDVYVEKLLNQKVASNEFYPLVKYANLCVEVVDLKNSVSYQIVKTPSGHIVKKAPLSCAGDLTKYDLSVRFNTWNSFNVVAQKMSCDTFRSQHKNKGFYVLPSKYILPGFKLNHVRDPTPYCPVLNKCLSEEEFATVGIAC